ncbi:hypothetical protein C8J56DRAFT_959545, partial [Mycena floridula]
MQGCVHKLFIRSLPLLFLLFLLADACAAFPSSMFIQAPQEARCSRHHHGLYLPLFLRHCLVRIPSSSSSANEDRQFRPSD